MLSKGAGGLVAAIVATACLLLWAPAAFAATPVNDDFEDAQALIGSLPIGISTTNAEATKELGEPSHGSLGSKGHSVWFEWEATSTGFVTVGTCGSDFTTVTSVYTGTKVDELTKVAGDYSSQGPGCPSFDGLEITFKAIGGTTYSIAVDGDPFYLPPAEPPAGEGAIELQVKTTPVPPNDDFADATTLTGSTTEEEGAETAFYWANAGGFNWNAGKEEGEPDHAGDPGGASVWYSWTAPGSGAANASACEGKPVVIDVYTGNSLDTLAPVGSNEFSCGAAFSASAGSTYRIAVDGKFDVEAGGPALRSFRVHVFMQLPPRPQPKCPPTCRWRIRSPPKRRLTRGL